MQMHFVLSLAGRDMGRVALEVGETADGRVLVADGRTHRISNPKKKNPKHLVVIAGDVSPLDSLIHRGALTDTELAKACKAVEDALDETDRLRSDYSAEE